MSYRRLARGAVDCLHFEATSQDKLRLGDELAQTTCFSQGSGSVSHKAVATATHFF